MFEINEEYIPETHDIDGLTFELGHLNLDYCYVGRLVSDVKCEICDNLMDGEYSEHRDTHEMSYMLRCPECHAYTFKKYNIGVKK